MIDRRSARHAAVVSVVLLAPGLARGQEPLKAFDQLNTRLSVGDKIYVTDTQGREHEGKVLQLSASSLTLYNGAAKKLAVSDVQLVRLRQHDGLLNGALIGAGVGVGLVLVTAASRGEDRDQEAGWARLAAVAWGAIGAGIGAGVDALIPGKKQIVYQAPGSKPSARLTVVPLVTPSRKGIAVSVGV